MTQSGHNKEYFDNLSEVKLNELRKMIIGLDTEDLRRLTLLLNDPEAFSEEISGLLPNSIKRMLEKGYVSYTVLIPLVESALKDSIQRDPQTLSSILFPVMLPAIRKAVAEDIKNMVDSLNTTLGNGFSPQRIGWRFKAIFSGMSYAEIVLSNAFIFRVKQVFLIHKETGLLLNSAADSEDAVTKDADMVSSMLTAIKDFVQDSFDVDSNNELNTIKVGKFNIWIEQGPNAILAAIVDGDAFSGYRTILKETIEKIHLKLSYELETFEGDVDVFNKTHSYLQSCLVSEQKKKKKKKPVALIIILLLLIGAGSYWAYISIEKNMRINKLDKALRSEPGFVIIDDDKIDGKIVFEGLRDPLAVSPAKLSDTFNVDTSEVAFNLKPYISLENNIILKRAYSLLQPPASVKLSINNGVLYASGESDISWEENSSVNYLKLRGINKFNCDNLNIINDNSKIDSIIRSIEKYYFVFDYNTAVLNDEQDIMFDNLIKEVNTLLEIDFTHDSVPVIVVVAHTSYDGNPTANEKVAFKRAQRFINLMIDAGIAIEILVPKSNYIENAKDTFPVRSVSFKVIFSKPEDL